jgi:predicted peroxiredoxin
MTGMNEMSARRLIIKCTVGTEEPERCNQAFTDAASALAAGVNVSLWLTGEATWLATPGRAETFDLPHSAPLADLRDTVLEDGTLTVCTQCAARRGMSESDLLPGTMIRGSASFIAEVLEPATQALVY